MPVYIRIRQHASRGTAHNDPFRLRSQVGRSLWTFVLLFFFFSSRRRHTRYWRDWSSDVCSSDLFSVEVLWSKRLASARTVRFQFVETSGIPTVNEEPGLREFLRNPGMSGDASEEEINFLKSLKFVRKRPSALYYYRELQSLRDPLHFPAGPKSGKFPRQGARGTDDAKRRTSRKRAIRA